MMCGVYLRCYAGPKDLARESFLEKLVLEILWVLV
jgi:hypothetical protein